MGNLNDPLVSGDQKDDKENSGESKPNFNSLDKNLTATFQTADMKKLSIDRDDESTIEITEMDKPLDKTSVVYAPKKRFLKDYQTEGSLLSAIVDSKSQPPQEKVSLASNVSPKLEDNNNSTVAKPHLETMNISSCIGVIVESELMKYEMCKDNSEDQQPQDKSLLLPMLFTPYSSQIPINIDDKYNQRSLLMANVSKEKYYVKNAVKTVESAATIKSDVEFINCFPDGHPQRYDKSRLSEAERSSIYMMKSKDIPPHDNHGLVSKQFSPRSLRTSPMNAAPNLPNMTSIPPNSQTLEEWKMINSDKIGYSYHNLPYTVKQTYTDHSKPPKLQDIKINNQIPFKAPPDVNYRRNDVQVSPKLHSRHQSPREIPASDTIVPGFNTSYNKEDFHGYVRPFDPRYQQHFNNEKYTVAHHFSQSSPQMRVTNEETPIDLRVKKTDKSSFNYNNLISLDPSENKRLKFHGSYEQPTKSASAGQYYNYLPAESDKGHHISAPSLAPSAYNQSFLRAGDAETLKTYLSDQYQFVQRHSELPSSATKPRHGRPDNYPYREGYGPQKMLEENLGKSHPTWERNVLRGGEQQRSLSRRHYETYDSESSASHYFKYESNKSQDSKSSSPRLIPQLLPISPISQVRNSHLLNYPSAHETQNFQCRLCNSEHSSYRSFRMHFVKDHGLEPHPEHCLSIVGGKSTNSYAPDQRAFPSPKIRQEADGFLSVPKQVAEVYPIISKVSPAYAPQGILITVDQADVKSKNLEKAKSDEKTSSIKEGFEELKQVLPWDCRHQLALDSEMNCATCMEGFQDITDWRAHISSMHMVRSCACRTCNKWFANAEELNKHLQGSHPEHRQVDVEYRCLYCRKAFTDEEVLYIHTREHERALSISRIEGKFVSRDETEIQKAVPDTTCPESDQKAPSDSCDLASAISPTSDTNYDQERVQKADEENKAVENSKASTEGDSEKTPSSKKSFFLKKFQQEEMSSSADADASKTKSDSPSDARKQEEKLASHQKIVTARSLIDNLVTESLTRDVSLAGFPKLQPFAVQPRLRLDFGNSSESGSSKSSQESHSQSSEFLLGGSSNDHSQKQPLLKDMLLQMKSKTPFSFNTETNNSNCNQPRTKCVRDICDEIITHSFRESSSPLGPPERLKIFDSIAFDTTSSKTESSQAKNSRNAVTSPTKTSIDSSTSHESKCGKSTQDSEQTPADSTEKANNIQPSSAAESRKHSESPDDTKRFVRTPEKNNKGSIDYNSDADSTAKVATRKLSSPTQSVLGKRGYPSDQGDSVEVTREESTSASLKNSSKDDVSSGESEPPAKKKDAIR